MSSENGEKRRESGEHPAEEDKGTDNVEWCLNECSIAIKKAEGSSHKLGWEPDPVVPLPQDEGLTKAEIAIIIDEVLRELTHKPETVIYTSNSVSTGENKEEEDKPASSGGGATEASKMEELKKDPDGKSQSGNEQTQPPQGGGGIDHHREGQDKERDKKAVVPPPEAAEQEQANTAPNKRAETQPTQETGRDQGKEIDPTAKQENKKQEERDTLKLGDDPKAFVDATRQLLANEGITPENNEVKLSEKTTLKLDEKDGPAIIERDQHYKITRVDHEKIGDLELNRYKTKQGEEFLHIPKENILVPPYETPWYALPAHTRVYLDYEYKRELLEATIEKAGGKREARQELAQRGTKINREYLIGHLHDQTRGIRPDKLIPILTYLQKDLNEPNSHITGIGTHGAIEKPNLPFKLHNIDGARIEAARFSDGTLSQKSQGRGPEFKYYNRDAELRNSIVESLTGIFGKPNIINREYTDGRVARVHPTTEVIGHALKRSGGVIGEVIKENPDIPTFIREGAKELKREWLRQAFGDEGSTESKELKVTLSRAVDATDMLSDNQKKRLDEISKGWPTKVFPDGPREYNKYCSFGDITSEDIQTALMLKRPRLLESEAKMLHDDFGIETYTGPRSVCRRKDGGYSVTWTMQLTAEGTRAFFREIGFPQKQKQEKLLKALGIEGDGNH